MSLNLLSSLSFLKSKLGPALLSNPPPGVPAKTELNPAPTTEASKINVTSKLDLYSGLTESDLDTSSSESESECTTPCSTGFSTPDSRSKLEPSADILQKCLDILNSDTDSEEPKVASKRPRMSPTKQNDADNHHVVPTGKTDIERLTPKAFPQGLLKIVSPANRTPLSSIGDSDGFSDDGRKSIDSNSVLRPLRVNVPETPPMSLRNASSPGSFSDSSSSSHTSSPISINSPQDLGPPVLEPMVSLPDTVYHTTTVSASSIPLSPPFPPPTVASSCVVFNSTATTVTNADVCRTISSLITVPNSVGSNLNSVRAPSGVSLSNHQQPTVVTSTTSVLSKTPIATPVPISRSGNCKFLSHTVVPPFSAAGLQQLPSSSYGSPSSTAAPISGSLPSASSPLVVTSSNVHQIMLPSLPAPGQQQQILLPPVPAGQPQQIILQAAHPSSISGPATHQSVNVIPQQPTLGVPGAGCSQPWQVGGIQVLQQPQGNVVVQPSCALNPAQIFQPFGQPAMVQVLQPGGPAVQLNGAQIPFINGANGQIFAGMIATSNGPQLAPTLQPIGGAMLLQNGVTGSQQPALVPFNQFTGLISNPMVHQQPGSIGGHIYGQPQPLLNNLIIKQEPGGPPKAAPASGAISMVPAVGNGSINMLIPNIQQQNQQQQPAVVVLPTSGVLPNTQMLSQCMQTTNATTKPQSGVPTHSGIALTSQNAPAQPQSSFSTLLSGPIAGLSNGKLQSGPIVTMAGTHLVPPTSIKSEPITVPTSIVPVSRFDAGQQAVTPMAHLVQDPVTGLYNLVQTSNTTKRTAEHAKPMTFTSSVASTSFVGDAKPFSLEASNRLDSPVSGAGGFVGDADCSPAKVGKFVLTDKSFAPSLPSQSATPPMPSTAGAQPTKFMCGVCNKFFGNTKNLRVHISEIHEGKRGQFPCDICHKVFPRKRNMERHKNALHLKNSPVCHMCQKVVVNLDMHVKRFHRQAHKSDTPGSNQLAATA